MGSPNSLPESPVIREGKQFVDDRGTVSFVNVFNPMTDGIERFYTVKNIREGYIRAWHGHRKESKFVMVVSGTAMIQTVKMDVVDSRPDRPNDWRITLPENQPERFILCESQPKVLWIPPGYYNGFKSLSSDARIMFFSTSKLEESKGDDFRLEWNRFGEEIWAEDFR